jgi:short-subunit dehydrogenase
MNAWNSALVTGASGGIGEALARRLASQGADLLLVARRRDDLDRIAAELRAAHNVVVDVLTADLTTSEGIQSVERRISERVPDVVVNNAGFGIVGPFHTTDAAKVDGMVRLNVLALTRLSHVAIAAMVERGSGAVVNVGSVAGYNPGPNLAVYNATKSFVISLTEALAEELRGTGVQVQVLCPGLTRTGFQEVAGDVGDSLPGFLWQDPDEVAGACLAGLRRGDVVVIPGVHNKAFVAGTQLLPASARRRLAGISMRARGRDRSPV